MVRDKFVFSIRDLTVKERLLREDKLTLEKAISMARASEASKEQIKMMATKEQNSENPSVNGIRYGDKQKQSSSRRPGSSSGSQKKKLEITVALPTELQGQTGAGRGSLSPWVLHKKFLMLWISEGSSSITCTQ